MLTADGPISLSAERAGAVARGVSLAHDLAIERAENAALWDAAGRRYLDFIGGIGVANLGHRHPRILEAIREGLERYTHLCFQVTTYPEYVRLAERLNALAPGDFEKRTLLLTTGAEAIENAVKIARQATGRPGIVTFDRGYHGRTYMALAMTAKTNPYKQHFGPFPGDVYHAPYPYEFRGWTTERALEALDRLFESAIAPDLVAAIVIEPVLGEGGFVPAPAAFMQALRERCDRHGILLIADEIQSGFGRTASMFAVENAGVAPDLMTVAKSLAGGLPLSGVVGRAEVMDAAAPGGLGGTYAGNPLACAAAIATLDIFGDEHILERADHVGQEMQIALDSMRDSFPHVVVDSRGAGAMRALEFASVEFVTHTIDAARERGLLLLKAGAGDVIRFLPPLTIGDEDLADGLSILAESIVVAANA
jgi:4-aminobutyrate aminotransferase